VTAETGRSGPPPVRVVLADDQAMVRAGFRLILEAEGDIQVVGEAADGRQAVEVVRRTRPDIVLMDVQMPRLDGLSATRELLEGPPGGHLPRVIILTTFETDEYIFEALRAGACGFLLKNAPAEDLVSAIRAVVAGGALLAPSVTRRIIGEFSRRQVTAPASRAALAQLTDREHEVLVLLAQGLTNAEIADRLVVAEATVKTHVSSVLGKLELRDRVQAVIFAYESGLLGPGTGTPGA
jgi:DNA-binding NarL/FixJ family response regulator